MTKDIMSHEIQQQGKLWEKLANLQVNYVSPKEHYK